MSTPKPRPKPKAKSKGEPASAHTANLQNLPTPQHARAPTPQPVKRRDSQEFLWLQSPEGFPVPPPREDDEDTTPSVRFRVVLTYEPSPASVGTTAPMSRPAEGDVCSQGGDGSGDPASDLPPRMATDLYVQLVAVHHPPARLDPESRSVTFTASHIPSVEFIEYFRSHSVIAVVRKSETGQRVELVRIPFDPSPLLLDHTLTVERTVDVEDTSSFVSVASSVGIRVGIDRPLLDEATMHVLNPMTITVRSARNLPDTPVSFEQLRESCFPVYCRFQVPGTRIPIETHTVAQSARIEWNHRTIVFVGTLDQQALCELWFSEDFCIEVHDRDRKPRKNVSPLEQFIEQRTHTDKEDTSRRRELTRDPTRDPFGHALISFRSLCHGGCEIKQTVNIYPARHSVRLEDSEERSLPGHYVACSSQLKVIITLHHPLGVKVGGGEGFCRAVCATRYAVDEPVRCTLRLLDKLASTHAREQRISKQCRHVEAEVDDSDEEELRLEGENSPEDSEPSPPEAQQVPAPAPENEDTGVCEDTTGNEALWGFQLTDGEWRVLVVEGRPSAVSEWAENVAECVDPTSSVFLHNTATIFWVPLYRAFQHEFKHLRIRKPLSWYMTSPEMFVRSKTPAECFEGFRRVNEILQQTRLVDLKRLDLFPSVSMLSALERRHGGRVTDEDVCHEGVP